MARSMFLPIEGIVITLPFATPSQNVYMRWHYHKRNRFRDEARMHIRSQIRMMPAFRHRSPVPEERRIGVEFLRRGVRQLDYGNLVGGGMKAVLDALVLEGLLKDDSPKWVQDAYHQERCRKGQESTRIWLYPAIEQKIHVW